MVYRRGKKRERELDVHRFPLDFEKKRELHCTNAAQIDFKREHRVDEHRLIAHLETTVFEISIPIR